MSNELAVQWPAGRVGLPVNWTRVLLAVLSLLVMLPFATTMAESIYQYVVSPEVRMFASQWAIIIAGVLLLALVVGVYHAVRVLLSQLVSGHLRIIAVAIANTRDTAAGRVYEFTGAGRLRTVNLLRLLVSLTVPIFGWLLKPFRKKLPSSRFKKNAHKLLYLDEENHIALAAETCRGGAAVLLDEDLTYLRFPSQQDQQLLLMALRSVQDVVARTPGRLQEIIKGIEDRERENQEGKKRRARVREHVTTKPQDVHAQGR